MPCANMSSFLPARAKLWLGSLDDPRLEVRAQYNPKELQLDKQIPWAEHKAKKGQDSKKGARDTSDQSDLEFTGAPVRSMTLELLFDTFERTGESVDKDIEILEQLSSVMDDSASKPGCQRPHHCLVVWGASGRGMKPFRCVIESVSVKYTLWDTGGMPQRATCTVKLKGAYRMQGSQSLTNGTLYSEKRRPSWWTHEDGGAYDDPHSVMEHGRPVQKGMTAEEYEKRLAEIEKAQKE